MAAGGVLSKEEEEEDDGIMPPCAAAAALAVCGNRTRNVFNSTTYIFNKRRHTRIRE